MAGRDNMDENGILISSELWKAMSPLFLVLLGFLVLVIIVETIKLLIKKKIRNKKNKK